MNMRPEPVVAIVQARMGSTRLPGKVLEDIAGRPMLAHVVERAKAAETIDRVVIATSDESKDDAIVEACRSRGWTVHRGPEEDVLERYAMAAKAEDAACIVRLTGDCPLLDPKVVDLVVEGFHEADDVDYCSNTRSRTYPRGLDTEVMSSDTLVTMHEEARDPAEREHVTLFVHRNPDRFVTRIITHERDLSHHRWTVDTPEDLELVRRIVDALGSGIFGMDEVVAFLETNPDVAKTNAHVRQKEVEG